MSGHPFTPVGLALFRPNLVDNYTTYALLALVAFEYLLTLPFEARLWSRRRWSISSVLYLASRYLMVAIAVLDAVPYTEKALQTCADGAILQQGVDTLTFVVLTVFATIRVYAVRRNDKILPFFVMLSGLLPIAVNGYIFAHQSTWYRHDPVLGTICDFTVQLPTDIYFPLIVLTRLGFIVMDSVVLGVTAIATARHIRTIASLKNNITLSGTLLRDGSLYFIMLVVTNVADILVNVPEPVPHVTNPVGASLLVVHPLLVSRFLMNLQNAYYGDADADALEDATIDKVKRFSKFEFVGREQKMENMYGDMGMSLAFDYREEEEEDDYLDEYNEM